VSEFECQVADRLTQHACDKLGLVIRHDPATELVAKFIVKLAQSGVHDVETLLKTALKEFALD
jgi:hypothetical protein